ncbi:MAG: acyl carrier protein [Planctomycetes bacterium]|nr:acyl carrier protein [Planctomycetota bacterium]
MPPTSDEIFAKVRDVLVDALAVDDDQVAPEATIVGDLGAESIDFLDMTYKLEKLFGVEIQRSELFPDDILTNAVFVKDGVLTADGIAELRKRMPFADLSRFESEPQIHNLGNLLTVSNLCRLIENKLAAARP